MTSAPEEFPYDCPLCGLPVCLLFEHIGVEVPCPHCGESWTASPAVAVLDPVRREELFGAKWTAPSSRQSDPRFWVPAPDVSSAVPRSAPPVPYSCPRCERKMELRVEHAGHEVPCPFCGFAFTPDSLDVVPGPRRQSVGLGSASARTTWAIVLGIFGILAVPFSLMCCLAMPLVAAGPGGLFLIRNDRKDAKADGREDSTLHVAWILCWVATGLAGLSIAVSIAIFVVAMAASAVG